MPGLAGIAAHEFVTTALLHRVACRINIFHIAPTRSTLADGLAQYLIWKRWLNWVLIFGILLSALGADGSRSAGCRDRLVLAAAETADGQQNAKYATAPAEWGVRSLRALRRP
jgi:hypothetical protein